MAKNTLQPNGRPLTKNDFDKSIVSLQKTLVGGMNQMLTTIIDHMDKRFEEVDNRFDRLELKIVNTSDDHAVRITKLETAITPK